MNGDAAGAHRRSALLDQAYAEFLVELGSGQAFQRSEFLARFSPDVAGELARLIDARDRIEKLLVPLGGGGPPPFPVGRRLGSIELREVVGSGSFGTVYRGWDTDLRLWVAVKALRGASADVVKEAFREARAVAQLTHPGIVRLFTVSEADGVPYLVTEFVQGRTLAEEIKKDRPGPNRAAEVVAAVADALDYAHRAGVIHRDVKPANVLMRDERTPVLTDFGLARWDAGDETLTADGRVVGTLAYMSPEQARGQSKVDGRSDVYALGGVLYELLTGARPFAGSVARGVLNQIEHADPLSPRVLADRVPRDLETVCLRCLQKEPGRRYASAADLAADLRRHLAGEPILARPVGWAERLGRWQRKNPWLAAAAAAAVALTAATVWLSVAWAIDSGRKTKEVGAALAEARRVEAETQFDRGLTETERGDVAQGLLWMARSLKTDSGPGDRAWAVRANLSAWSQQLVTLTGCWEPPPGRVLAFSPDGETAWFWAPNDLTIRRWGVRAGAETGPPLKSPIPGVHCAAVSPDGKWIAGGSRSGRFVVWPTAGGEPSVQSTTGPVEGMTYSADGKRLVIAVDTGLKLATTVFREWDGTELRELAGSVAVRGSVAVTADPDGRSLLTAHPGDREVRRWDTTRGELREWILRHPAPVTAVAVRADGARILTGAGDRAARLWDAPTGRLLGVLHHRSPVTAVAFGPDGKTVLTAGAGDAIRTWALPDDPDGTRAPLPAKARAAAIHHKEGLLAVGTDDSHVRVWKFDGGGLLPVGQPLPHPQPIRSVTFSADAQVLAVIPFVKTGVHLWNPVTGASLGTFPHPDQVRQVCASPDESRVVTVGFDRVVRVWDGWTGRPATPHTLGDGHPVCSVAFRPGGRELLAADRLGRVHRWDVVTGGLLEIMPLHDSAVAVLRSNPLLADQLVTADEAGVAQVWAEFAPIGPRVHHGFAVSEAAVSPDGQLVFTGGVDGKTRVWNAQTGEQVGPALRHGGQVRAIAVSRTNRWVATASDDGTTRVWAVRAGRPIGPPIHHAPHASCALIDPSDQWIVTTGADRTIRCTPAPAELLGEPEPIAARVRIDTGAELDSRGDLRILSPADWRRAAR